MIVALGGTTEQHIGRASQLRSALETFARGTSQAINAGNFEIAGSLLRTLLVTAGEWRAQLLEVGQYPSDDPINAEIDDLWSAFLNRFRATPAPPMQVASTWPSLTWRDVLRRDTEGAPGRRLPPPFWR